MNFNYLFLFFAFFLTILQFGESDSMRVPDNQVVCPPDQKFIKKRCRTVLWKCSAQFDSLTPIGLLSRYISLVSQVLCHRINSTIFSVFPVIQQQERHICHIANMMNHSRRLVWNSVITLQGNYAEMQPPLYNLKQLQC